MNPLLADLKKTADRIFGTTWSKAPDSGATVSDLVRRGTSHVRVDGKIYRVVAAEIEVTK